MKHLLKTLRRAYALFRDTDWKYIIPCLLIHLKYRNSDMRRRAMQHVKRTFLERRFLHICEKYRNSASSTSMNEGPIWVCWFQGEEDMPPVVKRCYERLKLMAPSGREVVLLHFGNIDQYVRIPDYIYEKFRKGYISFTHFSDILRLALLAEKGGLWVDSTLFCSTPIPEAIFSKPYYSIKTEYDPAYVGVNRCLWKCFLMGAGAQSQWFLSARDIVYDYCARVDYFIDYLLMDYILLLIYDSNDNVKSGLDAGVELAPHVLGFEKIANEPFDEAHYQKMCSECRWFKLSYKLPFKEYTEDGKLTYFGRLMSEK